MAKVRISTTVDPVLLTEARSVSNTTDASLIEAALRAYLAAHRRSQVDALYETAYRAQPVDVADEWGDLESFGAAVRAP